MAIFKIYCTARPFFFTAVRPSSLYIVNTRLFTSITCRMGSYYQQLCNRGCFMPLLLVDVVVIVEFSDIHLARSPQDGIRLSSWDTSRLSKEQL